MPRGLAPQSYPHAKCGEQRFALSLATVSNVAGAKQILERISSAMFFVGYFNGDRLGGGHSVTRKTFEAREAPIR